MDNPTDFDERCADVLAEIAMPFEYQLPSQSGVSAIRVKSDSGAYRDLVFGPWGAHTSPHTGHPEGNAKADMMLPFTRGVEALTYVPDPQQACTEELYAANAEVMCGVPKQALLDDRFGYVAPGEGYAVVDVFKEMELDFATSNYVFDEPQWKVIIVKRGARCDLTYSFGHIAWPGSAVLEALEQRGVDWKNAPVGVNLSDYEDPIAVPAGAIVAYPQIVGRPTPLDAAYAVPHLETKAIWTQIEFGVMVSTPDETTHSWIARSVPVYEGLSPSEYATWTAAFVDALRDPTNPRYGTYGSQLRRWLWAAEGELILAPGFDVTDASKLTAALGSWLEGHPDCASDSRLCDEMVAFFPIHRDTELFADVEDEFHPATRFMLAKARGADQSRVYGEVIDIWAWDEDDDAFAPTASLDDARRGALLVRLRPELLFPDMTESEKFLGFQLVTYDLDPEEARLVLAWGDLRETRALALGDLPAAPPTQAAPCTGASQGAGSTTCLYKRFRDELLNPGNIY